MAVVKTIISIPSLDQTYSIPGDFDAATIKSLYSSQIPQLASMTDVSSVATTTEGDVRTVTFSPRSGQKG